MNVTPPPAVSLPAQSLSNGSNRPPAATSPAANSSHEFRALSRIPTPPRHRWRIFCAEALPIVIFGCCGLGVFALWSHSAATPTLVAEAEIVRSDVRVALAGKLADLKVRLLQPVAAGDVIARLHTTDPTVLAASLGIIRAEIDLLRAGLEPTLGPRRVALESARLQLEWMRERVALASLRMQLQQAESDLARIEPLHRNGTASEQLFETTRLLRERLAAETAEQQKLVETLAPSTTSIAAGEVTDALAAALRMQEEKLRLTEAQLAPVAITAPIAGLVSALPYANGATVAAGDVIATISASESTRVIGFLRQPLPLEPREGMRVELRARTHSRRAADATIAEVGRALEPVSPTVLALFNRAATPELGLRVHIAVPRDFALHPGEQVDVVISGL